MTYAQGNSWISATRGFWDDYNNWSLGVAPSTNGQSFILITNAATKTVTIDVVTAGQFPDTMTISNMTVSAPTGSTNTLLVSSIGTDLPLTVLASLSVSNGGMLVISNSVVNVSGGTNGNFSLGGNLVVQNASLLVSNVLACGPDPGSPGTLTVAGGTGNFSGTLCVGLNTNALGSVLLAGGQLVLTNGPSAFGVYGAGQMTISNNSTLTSDRAVIVGLGAGSQGDVTLDSSSWVAGEHLIVGQDRGATGTVRITGEQLTVTNVSLTLIGGNGSGQQVWSNATITAGALEIGAGSNSLGTLTVIGGSTQVQGGLFVGTGLGATGVVWMTGGQLIATNWPSFIAPWGYGVVTISNGNWLGNSMLLGSASVIASTNLVGTLSRGIINVNGGSGTLLSKLVIGNCPSPGPGSLTFAVGGVGVVNVNAGSLFVTNATHNAFIDVRNGQLNINGGLVQVDKLVMTNTCGLFTRGGGTLIVSSVVLATNTDADGDGMLNGWEQAYGFDPLNPADARVDSDGDGASNLQEYQAGTDPTNAVSYPTSWPTLIVTNAVSGLAAPTQITHAGDGSGRLFICEQAGRIRIVTNRFLLSTPFLNITSRVNSTDVEQGLLGLAFAPGYTTNGHFYVAYTDVFSSLVVSRFTVSADPNVGNTNSEQHILTIPKPYTNHNGGQLAFGPDGYLYIGVGDGGGGGDPLNSGQTTTNLLGKILRIDPEGVTQPYAVPPTNPFVGNGGYRPEIWAYGLRNPWKFSFDRLTGELYIADVGQSAYEEIDYRPAADPGGENYGWRWFEATHPYNLPAGADTNGLTWPVIEYSHGPPNNNCSVIGGFVYRGSAYPRMQGMYFFGDFCSGLIWGSTSQDGTWYTNQLYAFNDYISTFGEDDNGNLYVARYYSGTIYQIQDFGMTFMPVFVPTGGVYNTELMIAVSNAIPAAVIHYTTNGINPTADDPTISSGGSLPVDTSLTLKAQAFLAGMNPSPVATANYILKVGTPVFNPNVSPIPPGLQISISTVTMGATIHYTLDGSTPGTDSPIYSTPITIVTNTTLKAIGTKANFFDSEIQTMTYTTGYFYDWDGDGIPDSWTSAYFGHPTGQTNDLSCASCEADGDGMSNLAEFQADTDPTNSASVFGITAMEKIGADVRVSFNSVSGKYYSLKRCDTIGGAWTTIVDNIPGNSGIQQATDIGGASRATAFYRVRLGSPDDSDGDGLADWWTQLYFGHPAGQASDSSRAIDDPDGDGQNNLQEFQAGTDATNSASFFGITSITQVSTNILVTWQTAAGKTNALDRSTGAPGGSFSNNFTAIFTVTNTVGTTTNYLDLGGATSAPSFYYRVRLVP